MNLPISVDNTEQINFHFLLEEGSDGQILGTIAELPGCQITAIEQEENPWTEFMGMYKDDSVFAEIAAELRAERGLEHLGWVK